MQINGKTVLSRSMRREISTLSRLAYAGMAVLGATRTLRCGNVLVRFSDWYAHHAVPVRMAHPTSFPFMPMKYGLSMSGHALLHWLNKGGGGVMKRKPD
jgi:hypothetical protein